MSEIIIISSYDFLLGWRLLPRGLDTKWPLAEKGLIRQEAKGRKKERGQKSLPHWAPFKKCILRYDLSKKNI